MELVPKMWFGERLLKWVAMNNMIKELYCIMLHNDYLNVRLISPGYYELMHAKNPQTVVRQTLHMYTYITITGPFDVGNVPIRRKSR